MTDAKKATARKTRSDKGTKVPAADPNVKQKAPAVKKARTPKKTSAKNISAPKKIKQTSLAYLVFNLRQVFDAVSTFGLDYESLKIFVTKELSDSLNRVQAIDVINDKLRDQGAFCMVIDQTEMGQGIVVVSNSRPFVSSEKPGVVYNPMSDKVTIARELLAPELISFKYGSAFDKSDKVQEW